jgi:proton-translocating NADH-quinone oxidoreductase chain L
MYLALLALPLSTFICLALFGRFLGARGTILLSVFSACACTVISSLIFYEVALCACACQIHWEDFVSSALFDATWGFLFDSLTAVMCVVVTLISCLVIIYSCSYMIMDPHFIRFISYLKLFTVAMLILVTANNYVQLFVGWEGVGLASFLLISFWFNRLQASKAAIQAMLVNRVGDVGLALGIATLFFCYKTTNYQALFCINNVSATCELETLFGWSMLDIACLLLFIGAAGKSGQFGLHIWLPNAMNAPTPVSALLHAATMVTAGVFLLARSSALFEHAPKAAAVVVVMGAITTIAAGTMGLAQNDFKSIIAYSTCSQLGYMITICGLSNYDVGIFHLFNHSFFKALLFLTSGVIIHSLANEQDVRRFGGLQQTLVFSYTMLLVGTLALVGMPFLTGFYSKDVILELACARYGLVANFGYLLTAFNVLITSYYSFRVLFMVFFAAKQTNLHKQSVSSMHDADWVMSGVLIVLALGSIYAGWFFKPMFIGLGTDFWNNAIWLNPHNSFLIESEFLPQSFKLMPLVCTIMGPLIAYLFTIQWASFSYNSSYKHLRPFYLFCNQRWFYDKLINQTVAFPAYKFGFDLVQMFDKGLLELLPIFSLGLSNNLKLIYLKLGSTQSGIIYHYAMLMVISTLSCLYALTSLNLWFALDYSLNALVLVSIILS